MVPANNDLSNQRIIDLALKHTANPSNVVGVFTKCDTLPESEVSSPSIPLIVPFGFLRSNYSLTIILGRSDR